MDRHLIERWTDTALFGVALGLSGALVFPVLGLGLAVSAVMLVTAVAAQTAEFAGAVIVALSVGGAVGVFGLLRARYAVRSPRTHNVTATLLFLAIGTTTALAVAAIVAYPSALMLSTPGSLAYAWPGVPLMVAHVVWVLFGIGRMQKVSRRYAEETGRSLDGTPALMLLIAIALATTVWLIATAL